MFDKHSEACKGTVAILAQGTSWAKAVTMPFLIFDLVSNAQTLKPKCHASATPCL